MEKSLFNELTLEQKQKLLTLPAELKHFTQTQWAAIYGIVPMTQELFDSIQLERLSRRGTGICCPGYISEIP